MGPYYELQSDRGTEVVLTRDLDDLGAFSSITSATQDLYILYARTAAFRCGNVVIIFQISFRAAHNTPAFVPFPNGLFYL